MMRAPAVALLLALVPATAQAQGAVIETLDDLKGAADAPSTRGGDLPARVDLAGKMPPPRSQVATSTCVSWSVTYAAGSYAARRAGLGDTVTLSPAFTYNQVARDPLCLTGTAISKTLDLLRDVGALPIEEFVFDGGWCGRFPTGTERSRAARYRIKGWGRFDATNIDALKAQLARGVPVMFAMSIGRGITAHRGDGVITADEGIMGHAMTVVGYDEGRKALAIQNSFGRGWGDNGYAWFSYDFWRRSPKVGFVID
jgi:hypothetical protein